MSELIAKIVDKLLAIWLWFLSRRKKKAGDAFVDFAEINAIIKEWVHYKPGLHIERVLILKAHNGQSGKKLMPVGYKFISVIANDYRAPFHDVRSQYQNLPQDNQYVADVAKVYLNKDIDVQVAYMDPCVLKNLYQQEGVVFAKWYFLAHNEEELWFMTVATSQKNEYFDSVEHRTQLYLGVSRIREIIKPYFK